MPKISFTKHSTTGHIILLYNCFDGRIFYYTGQRGSDKGTVSLMSRLKLAVENLEVDYRIKGQPLTKDIVRKSCNQVLNKSIPTVKSIYYKWDHIISQMILGQILTPNKKKYSKGSIKAYNFTVSLLKEFNLPEVVTMDTYYKFIAWCHEKDYSTNYIGSQIKNFKRLGSLIGLSVCSTREFRKISEDAIDVYLDEQDLKKIYDLSISDNKLDAVRDWFILDCYTGLRVSDLVVLTDRNYSKGFITIANQKTGEKVVIPVHPYVKHIMKKHNGFPAPATSHEINIYIKSIAKSAGICDDFLHTITKGGKRKDSHLKKYQMITCHTARRSFITNLLLNGIPETIVMKLTGIKSYQTIKVYNKLSSEHAAKIAAELKFFKTGPSESK